MQDNNIKNNNKPTYNPEVKDNKENTTLVFGTIIFVVSFFVLGMILQYAFSYGVGSYFHVDAQEVIKASTAIDFDKYSKEVQDAALIATGWSNLIAYLITFIGMVVVLRKYLIADFKKIFNKEDSKKTRLIKILTIVLFGIGFAFVAIGIDFLFKNLAPESNNQSLIVLLMKSNLRIVIIIPTLILAPIVEELFYRKIAFTFLKRFKLPVAYIGCSLLFALPHMLSTDMSGQWFIQFLPYLICGGLLTFVYHINKENVFASIFAHMCNNLIAIILVFI